MKKALVFVLVGLLAGAAAMYFLGPARFPNKIKPAEPTSFIPVTSRLDSGGDLYGYLSTEQLIRSIEGLIAQLAKSLPVEADSKEAAILPFIFNLIDKSGIKEISGLGLSNVSLPGGLQRTRMVIHHDAEKNTGLIWQAAPTGPRTLSELKLLPADTALAAFGEFRLDAVWAWIKKELEASGLADVQKFAGQAESTLAAQGVDLPKLLGSLSGSIGYIVTLDKVKTIALPGEASGITVPEPGLAIVIGTKDSTLFDLVKTKLPMAALTEKDGRKTLQFSAIPAPIPLEPCIVMSEGFVIVATSPGRAEALLQARTGTGGLAATPEFKELAAHVPDRGNGFAYLSPRLFQIYVDLIEKAATSKPEDKQIAEALFKSFPRDLKALSVMERRFDGIVWTSCHNMSLTAMVMAPMTTAAGLAAAAAGPALAQAGDKAKVNSTMATLKTLGLAIEGYLVDNAKSPQAGSPAELQTLLAPFYIKELPLKDAWGNDLLYKKTGTDGYLIASPGKDGVFKGWDQKGEYPAGQFDEDIIFYAGIFVYGPVR